MIPLGNLFLSYFKLIKMKKITWFDIFRSNKQPKNFNDVLEEVLL